MVTTQVERLKVEGLQGPIMRDLPMLRILCKDSLQFQCRSRDDVYTKVFFS